MFDLSIVVVSYNTKDLTLQCIKSIRDSIKGVNYEVIVIDNGSADGTVASIQNVKLKLKILTNRENLGFARANNQGIKVAKGKYILLLNSDTEIRQGSVEELLKFAKQSPDAGVVGSRLLNKDGSIQPSAFRFPTINRAVSQYWLGKKGILDKYTPEGDMPSEVEAVVGASFLITPAALKRIGFLDGRYFMFYEDLDYCRRVWKSGLKVYYLPSSVVIHYHGASGEKLENPVNQWRRLIPSSKIYHGVFRHYLFNFVIWSGQKFTKVWGAFLG